MEVETTAFARNVKTSGGGIAVDAIGDILGGQESTVLISDSLFSDHEADLGAIEDSYVIRALEESVVDIQQSTIARNDAFAVGWVGVPDVPVRSDGSLSNSVVWDNAGGPVVLSPSHIIGVCNQGELGGVFPAVPPTDPMLITTPRGDFRLDPLSASIDACSVAATSGKGLDGVLRTMEPFDRGAFEF